MPVLQKKGRRTKDFFGNRLRMPEPFRVLVQRDGQIHTWNFKRYDEAERVFESQKDFERCMLLNVYAIDVKLLRERRPC